MTKDAPTTNKQPIIRRGRGRPSKRSQDLMEAILEMAAAGLSLSAIARTPGMPSLSQMHRWLRDDQTFAFLYRDACYHYTLRQFRAMEGAINNPNIPPKNKKALVKALKR